METHVQFTKRTDGLWLVRCRLIDGVEGIGETPEEAEKWYQHNLFVWIQKHQRSGMPLPIQAEAIDRPPFPRLIRDESVWHGRFTRPDLEKVEIRVASPLGADVHEDQCRAFARLVNPASDFWTTIKQSMLEEYARLLAQRHPAIRLPTIRNESDLLANITEPTVYVSSQSKEDEAILGICFNCSWDDEHGFGLMTHHGNVLRLGGADTAFDEGIAEEMGGVPIKLS